MFIQDGVFYWYGENKEKTVPGSGIWHWGVRCYRSTDLYNWEDLGLIIPPDTEDETSPLHPNRQMDRPHIIFNRRTNKYVCWIKVIGDPQRSTVLTADSLLGPYEIVSRDLVPLGMSAGDFDLVVDPHDGKGYYYFERVHSELICADLTDDYTNVSGYYSTHFPYGRPPFVLEAPAHFQRGINHYLLASRTTGYFPNQSVAAIAPTYHGPWAILGDPHPDDVDHCSFRSQISCVFKHPTKQDLYIAMADRWLPELSGDVTPRVMAAVERMFAEPEVDEHTGQVAEVPSADSGANAEQVSAALRDTNTSVADYVWLPIRFEGNMPILDWRDEWRLEDFQ